MRKKPMSFYKMLSESEKHYGMQYHFGLNVDVEPFQPIGDCNSGGIYFAREDVLVFINYWVRKVTLPKGEPVYGNPGRPKKWKAHRVILGKRERVGVKILARLIREGANPKAYESEALCRAAENGYADCVKLLIPVSDPKACRSRALCLAARNGHMDCVKLLIPVSDPKADESRALYWAAENGHADCVKLLIPVSDPLFSHEREKE